MNIDSSSWESIHPAIEAIYPNAEVSNPGGSGTLTIGNQSGNTRAYDTISLGGLHVMHEFQGPHTPGMPHLNRMPVYYNTWLRLDGPAEIITDTGELIRLEKNTLINPLQGTYMPGRNLLNRQHDAFDRLRAFEVSYLAAAEVLSELHLTRPVLELPPGTPLVLNEGGMYRNVKAAVFFSLQPLDIVNCAANTAEVRADETPTPTSGSQLRGIVLARDRYTSGYPCAWLDEAENTDGDLVYSYRQSDRYESSGGRANKIGNDRSYLIGGRLSVTVP